MAVTYRWRSQQHLVVVAGEVALEAADRLDAALAFGLLASEVFACRGVASSAGDRDDVQRPVELALAAAVQAVAIVSAGGHRNRCHAGDSREVSVALEALGSSGLPDQDRGAERAAADLGEQLRAMRADEIAQLALERLRFTS
jgi:hypothetical protein